MAIGNVSITCLYISRIMFTYVFSAHIYFSLHCWQHMQYNPLTVFASQSHCSTCLDASRANTIHFSVKCVELWKQSMQRQLNIYKVNTLRALFGCAQWHFGSSVIALHMIHFDDLLQIASLTAAALQIMKIRMAHGSYVSHFRHNWLH